MRTTDFSSLKIEVSSRIWKVDFHSCNYYFLSTFRVLGIFLGAEDIIIDTIHVFMECTDQ